MLHSLGRTQAIILIAFLLALAGWSLTIRPAPAGEAAPTADYSDLRLYHDMARRITAGDGYYPTATSLQREHGFPTHPFLTVRLPTLVMLAAWFGWGTMHAALAGLLVIATLLWFRVLEGMVAPAERWAATVMLVAGGAMVGSPGLTSQHELWAGILLAISLALRFRGQWVWAVIAAGGALAIRELALPFVLLAALFAFSGRNWRELAGWLALVGLFGVGLAFHAHAVNAQVLPGDLASQGWSEHRGPQAALRDLVDVSLLNLVPPPLAYLLALAPLFGWLAAPTRLARFAVPLFVGYMVMLALFARAQNFYWAIMLLPAYPIGYVFLPRAARDLAHAMLAGRPAAL